MSSFNKEGRRILYEITVYGLSHMEYHIKGSVWPWYSHRYCISRIVFYAMVFWRNYTDLLMHNLRKTMHGFHHLRFGI